MSAYQRTKRMKGLSRGDAVWIGTWTAVGAGLYAAYIPLINALWIFVLPIYLLHLRLGAGTVLLWGSRPLRDHWAPFWPAALALGCVVALILSSRHLGQLGVWIAFLSERRTYELVVAEVRSGRIRQHRGEYDGVSFQVDRGPPARVAFDWGGVIDNWNGVVWDPTGVVASADGWRQEGGRLQLTAAPESRELFGGDLVWCRRLSEDYFYCEFT